MVLPGVYVSTVPTSYVVDVVVVVAGAVVVCSVVVVLVCANANGAITAQANPIIIFFMVLPFSLLSFFRLSSRGKYSRCEPHLLYFSGLPSRLRASDEQCRV